MKKYIIQVIICLCLFLIIPLISNNQNISDVIKYLTSAVPVLYSLVLFTYYKPKNYLKFLSINSIKKDVGYSYKIAIKNYNMTKKNFDDIKDVLINMEKNNVFAPRMYQYETGDYKYSAVFSTGLFNIDLDYSVSEKMFIFECKTTSTYRKIIKRLPKLNERLLQNLNSAKFDIKMYIEFLVDKENSQSKVARNPFVYNIFREFSNRNLSLIYTGKHGTKIKISNNIISFQSDNLNSINCDIKKEITVFSLL